jgi:hypothetical protein
VAVRSALHLNNPKFVYVSAAKTDLHKSFARVRKQMALQKAAA